MNEQGGEWQSAVDRLWAQFDRLAPADFLAAMRELVSRAPTGSGHGLFELASAHDALDDEAQAIGLYREAIACGLPEETRRQAVLQLASSLRQTGALEESLALLEREVEIDDAMTDAATAFLCLSLMDAGRAEEAAARALLALAKHLPRYRKSITAYASAGFRAASPEWQKSMSG